MLIRTDTGEYLNGNCIAMLFVDKHLFRLDWMVVMINNKWWMAAGCINCLPNGDRALTLCRINE